MRVKHPDRSAVSGCAPTQLARHVRHWSPATWIRGCAVRRLVWYLHGYGCFLALLEVILEVVTGTGKGALHRRLLFDAQGTAEFVTETAMRFLCRQLGVWMDDIPEFNLDFGEPKCVQSACNFSLTLEGTPRNDVHHEWSLKYRPHSHRYCYLLLRTVQNAPRFVPL